MDNLTNDKHYLKNNKFFLRKTIQNDHIFIYNLIQNFLKTDLSVTTLTLLSFDEFFKQKILRYIISDDQNSLVGFVQILENNEVGVFIDTKYANQGLGTESLSLLMELNPKERYFATVHNQNESSKKLFEKAGFSPKATVYEKITNI